ncbi:MAG: recombinase family protein [Dehalococcoidia bacterium]|nr:recombinase family protein [Dehalococcoidia bacterium]
MRFYSDEGVSAHTDQIERRPQLLALLEDAARGHFDVVIVHTLDRWARNVGVQRQALQRLGDAHIGFASVTESIDFTTPAGRLMLTMIGGVSEFFSDQLGVHVAKSKKVRAESGFPVGPVPFGYQVDAESGVAIEVREEAAAVTGIFERKAAGDTNGQIADWLNARGLKTRTGRMFTAYTVKDMLRCRFYVGVVEHKGSEYAGRHAAIVEEELYERVQLRRRGERQPRRQRSGPPSVLHGMLHCGNCGSALHSDRNQFGYPLYRERHGWPCDTNGRSIVAHRVDEQIGKIISSVELRSDWRDRMAEFAVAGDDGPNLANLQGQRKRLSRAYADGAFSEAEYRVRLAEVDARIRAKTTASEPTIDEAAALFRDVPAMWAEAEPDERRRLVAPLIERVYVDIESRRIGAFTPSPAFRSLLQGALQRTRGSQAVILSPDETESLEMMAWWRRGRPQLQ